jgi:hypothetical protein
MYVWDRYQKCFYKLGCVYIFSKHASFYSHCCFVSLVNILGIH